MLPSCDSPYRIQNKQGGGGGGRDWLDRPRLGGPQQKRLRLETTITRIVATRDTTAEPTRLATAAKVIRKITPA
jgi:hypothetical protein